MNQRISLKINFLYLSAFNLCVFSGFFLTGITSMSPIYYAFLLAVLFFGLQIILLPFVKVKECIYEYIPLFLYIVYIILNAILWDTALKYPLLIALSAFYYFFSNVVLGPLSSLQIRKIIRWFIYLTFFLLIIECSYRIMHPSHFKWVTGDNFFYVFKFNSIMFTDSNEVGFLIMIFLGFLNYLKRECSIRFPFYLYIITFILLLLTFSRAALLGFLFSFFMINIYSQARLLYKLFVVGIGVIGGMYLLQYFLADGSFFTKLEIFSGFFEYINSLDVVPFLFGLGYANSELALGIYAHNYIALYFIEYGFVGLFLFCLLLGTIYLQTHKKFKYILIPYLIAGLSFAPYCLTYFFLMSALIKRTQERNF